MENSSINSDKQKKLNSILKIVNMQLGEEKDQQLRFGLKKGQEIFM